MNKFTLLSLIVPLFLASWGTHACVGRLSEQVQLEYIEKLDQDLIKKKLGGAQIVSEVVLNEAFVVGSRGNCLAVKIERVRKLEYRFIEGSSYVVTCTAYAASELSEGHPF